MLRMTPCDVDIRRGGRSFLWSVRRRALRSNRLRRGLGRRRRHRRDHDFPVTFDTLGTRVAVESLVGLALAVFDIGHDIIDRR